MIPSGTIFAFVGKTPPTGWALCDGATVPRTGEYAQLFSIVGETYGRGDGSTTFQIPDLSDSGILNWPSSAV
jgi:microcystin-dependent protein